MPFIRLIADTFLPSASPATGDAPRFIYRGNNMKHQAQGSVAYLRTIEGHLDLNENYNCVPLTGTISYSANNPIITGISSQFVSELHIGQLLVTTDGEFLAVDTIESNTQFTCSRPPSVNSSAGCVGYRMQQLSEINGKRCVMLTGNAVEREGGDIVAVGSGEVKINGQSLNSPLNASAKPRIAILDGSTGSYVVQDLGFTSKPAKPTINAVTGGTKGMSANKKHSFMVAWWKAPSNDTQNSNGTDGFSNPCDVVKLDGAGNPLMITATNNRYEIDFSPCLPFPKTEYNGFIVYASRTGSETTSVGGTGTTTISSNETNYQNGSWYRVAKIRFTDLVANKAFVEFLDTVDTFEEVTGDNTDAPLGEFVIKADDGRLLIVSCLGQKSNTSRSEGTNIGTAVLASKIANIDGFPRKSHSAFCKNDIIGTFEGIGRYLMITRHNLEFVIMTRLAGSSLQGSIGDVRPIASVSYWRTGGKNRYSMILIDDTLYGFSENKVFKSVGTAEENAQKYELGLPIEDFLEKVNAGHIYCVQDEKSGTFLLVHTASHKNAQGFWATTVYPYHIARSEWQLPVILESTTRDTVVSGVATINGHFEFLAGGRNGGGGYDVRTYRYNVKPSVATPVKYSVLWLPSDDGLFLQKKRINYIRVNGKHTNLKVRIFGTYNGSALPIEDIQNGVNPIAEFSFADTSQITESFPITPRLSNITQFAVGIYGEWNGTGKNDQIHEVMLGYELQGESR